jgi:hypothetical protein
LLELLHLRGRHKARVFASALQLFQTDAELLRAQLLNAAMPFPVRLMSTVSDSFWISSA